VRNDVEIAVIESDGKIVGFFPFHRRNRVARPVGEVISDYQGIICRSDFEFSPTELLKQSRLIAWEFDHLVAGQLSFAAFQRAVEPSPQIDLSRGYEAYVGERKESGSKLIKKVGNLVRRIEREIGAIRFLEDAADGAAFATVIGWKSDQYRRSGKHDLFASGWIHEVIRRILATRVDSFSGTLSLLYAGDRLVAGHVGMRSRRVWHYWFPSYDHEVAAYSPGLILLLKMAEQAPTIGAPLIDLGKGVSPYKERLMNSTTLLASGSIELPSWRAYRRKLWTLLRSQIVESPAGPAIRAGLKWFRKNARRTS
jgi:CelD/BcsL family acetyltransferase involved in cellulose biosynthesis